MDLKIKDLRDFPQLSDEKWALIKSSLETPICDLTTLIEKISVFSKMVKINVEKKFEIYLRSLFSEEEKKTKFFSVTLPGMQHYALQLLKYFPDKKYPTLPEDSFGRVELSRPQVLSILCHSFFCTFQIHGEAISVDFDMLYAKALQQPQEAAKLESILNYFEVMIDQARSVKDKDVEYIDENLKGKIRITRRNAKNNHPNFLESKMPLTKWIIDKTHAIEDCSGSLQVDFANCYIGGGVLCGGCVQEEIRFAICPELISAMLICPEPQLSDEAIIILGAKQYSKYKGYAFQLQFDGNFIDPTPFTPDGEFINTEICAIDAVDYRHGGRNSQFKKGYIFREVLKAYTGFYRDDSQELTSVATGNWGCGAFLGDFYSKSIIQYVAASQSGRDMIYCTFGNQKLTDEMNELFEVFSIRSELNVGTLYRLLIDYGNELNEGKFEGNAFCYFIQKLKH